MTLCSCNKRGADYVDTLLATLIIKIKIDLNMSLIIILLLSMHYNREIIIQNVTIINVMCQNIFSILISF